MLWQSFRVRLIAGAILWITVGLGMSWVAVVELFREHVTNEFLDELDHHGTELVGLIRARPDAPVTVRQPVSDHRFFVQNSGYYWQVDLMDGRSLRSESLGAAQLPVTLAFDAPVGDHHSVRPGPTGGLILMERIIVPGDGGPTLRLAVATDQSEIEDVLAGLRRTFGLSLAVIAAGLIVAAVAQVSFGLRPLNRVRTALAAIRLGAASRLPDDLPAEVAPLANSVNALLGANEEIVRRARTQAGNLAHALKTPLAVLVDEATRLQAVGLDSRVLLEQCGKMRRQIDYELAKARAAASHSGRAAAAPIAPAIGGIVSALDRLYRDKRIRFDVALADPAAIVACDREDLDEIIGNLADNAAKWCRSSVRIAVDPAAGGRYRLTIEDDGPGMPIADRERVFKAGERLDEQVPGTGLGLAIVRDIAELYGGAAWIEDAASGGARACVELPAVSRID